MVDISKVRAIDIHTHAEEPCGCHPDDGYDELQSTMARYFGAPWQHPPTIPETAAHYREKNVAAVIFPVDAERETGYRRYKNEEVAQLAAENSDILIPFASIDPHKGKLGAREARRRRCQSNGGSSTSKPTAISRRAIYAERARHSAKAAERLCL
jgi:uncharacterized protein